MNNYKKFGVIAGQILIGLGFSILGGIIGLICDYTVSATSGVYSDLFESILNSLIGCYIGLLIGICFDGYKFLKENGRENEFLKFLLVAVIGISCGILGLYLIVTNCRSLGLSNVLTNLLAVILPFIGILLGSVLVLIKDTRQT